MTRTFSCRQHSTAKPAKPIALQRHIHYNFALQERPFETVLSWHLLPIQTGYSYVTMHTILIDVGNTSTNIGRYQAGRVSHVTNLRQGLTDLIPVEKALHHAGAADAAAAILSSTTPATTPQWSWLLQRLFDLNPVILTHQTPLPIGIRYQQPETIGPDRLANACAAAILHGAPAIVADFGTALTFDILAADRHYIGGVIAPGLPLMTDYLYEKTALLPQITLEGSIEPIGTSTIAAMRIGARVGYRGMVRETIDYLRQTTGPETHLCATGGYAAWALEGLDLPFAINPHLTLQGLGLILSHNLAN